MTDRDSNGIVLADGKYSIKHIPDHYEHLVRYGGWYSNRARGEHAKKAPLATGVALPSTGEAPAAEFTARARAAWARLIDEAEHRWLEVRAELEEIGEV